MAQWWVTRYPRIAAGAWFAAAVALPGSVWIVPTIARDRDVSAFFLVVLLPLAATGFSGAWLGASILQRRYSRSRAFLQGVGVILGAFALLLPLYGIASIVMEPKTAGAFGGMLVQAVLALAVALLVTGWLCLPIGGIAGLLLQWVVRRGG